MEWLVILALGLAAGTIGGIVGFGTSIMLLPPLVIFFGPLEAVPVMAIAGMLANLSRVAVWWRTVDLRVCAVYSATAIPGAALGALTLLNMNTRTVEAFLGAFFLFMIPVRRWLQARGFRMRLWQMALVGAVIGYLSGIVASTGPVNTPFYLAYGLSKGAFLATEAVGSLSVSLTKAAVFNHFGALPWSTLSKGLIVGSSVMAGSWIAKGYVMKLDPSRFRLLMDALMLVAGLTMIVTAIL